MTNRLTKSWPTETKPTNESTKRGQPLSVLYLTGSQWRDGKMGAIWSLILVLVILYQSTLKSFSKSFTVAAFHELRERGGKTAVLLTFTLMKAYRLKALYIYIGMPLINLLLIQSKVAKVLVWKRETDWNKTENWIKRRSVKECLTDDWREMGSCEEKLREKNSEWEWIHFWIDQWLQHLQNSVTACLPINEMQTGQFVFRWISNIQYDQYTVRLQYSPFIIIHIKKIWLYKKIKVHLEIHYQSL